MIAQKILLTIMVASSFGTILSVAIAINQTEDKKEEFWWGLAFKLLFLFGLTTAIFLFTSIWIK